MQRCPQRQRAAHRLADDDDPRRARFEPRMGCGNLSRPIGPSRGEHLGDVGAVAGQAGNLDVQPSAGDRLAEATHRRRVAGEPVEREHAPGVAGGGVGERLGAGDDGVLAHGGRFSQRRRRITPAIGDEP
jgi:hypothetical protein